MSFGGGCFEDSPRYAELEKPEYPDLRLAVWALLKRLEAIQVAACAERGNDPLINNCRHALNGWEPPCRDVPFPSDGNTAAWEAGYMKGINDGCRNPN
jgi:hypothetical protein